MADVIWCLICLGFGLPGGSPRLAVYYQDTGTRLDWTTWSWEWDYPGLGPIASSDVGTGLPSPGKATGTNLGLEDYLLHC